MNECVRSRDTKPLRTARLGNVAVAIHKLGANGNLCTGPVLKMRLDTSAHRAFQRQYVSVP